LNATLKFRNIKILAERESDYKHCEHYDHKKFIVCVNLYHKFLNVKIINCAISNLKLLSSD